MASLLRRAFGRTNSTFIKIHEVGPRDGLQNERTVLTAPQKAQLIKTLIDAGLKHIEVGSFVSPKWVPQMADTEDVIKALPKNVATTFSALVPNMTGLLRAKQAALGEIAVFTAASEAFSRKNVNMSVEESLATISKVCVAASEHRIKIRAYISCVCSCPYSGPTAPKQVASIATRLLELGCYEVSLGDTIGVGTAGAVKRLLNELLPSVPASKLAGHFHNTYGQALANTLQALEMGLRSFDSSIAGLGGCPFARGATGNVATEDLVYMLKGHGLCTDIDFAGLLAASKFVRDELKLPLRSSTGVALIK